MIACCTPNKLDSHNKNSGNVVIQQIVYSIGYLVVSTHLKNISQYGNLPQIGVKIKNIWNHHPVGHQMSLERNQNKFLPAGW